jgi:predicted nucleic acid-binding protein
MNLSVPLLLEYEQTLRRHFPKESLSPEAIDTILEFLCAASNLRPIFFLWRPILPDPGDHMVLELAVESRSDFIITFNARDLSPASQFGIQIVTPAEFLAIMETRE